MARSLIRNNLRGNNPDVLRELGEPERPAELQRLRDTIGSEEYSLFLRNTPRADWISKAKLILDDAITNDPVVLRLIQRHTCQRLFTLEVKDGQIISAKYSYGDGEVLTRCHCHNPIDDLDWFEIPYYTEPIERSEALRTSMKMACSNCWGISFRLEAVKDENNELIGDLVICTICQENTRGYVSRRFVEKMRQRDIHNYMNARRGLKPLLGIQQERSKNPLKDLGF